MSDETPAPPADAAIKTEAARGLLGFLGGLRIFEALHYREYRLSWFGQIFASLATWMDQVARGWLLYELTNSTLQLGLACAASRRFRYFCSRPWRGAPPIATRATFDMINQETGEHVIKQCSGRFPLEVGSIGAAKMMGYLNSRCGMPRVARWPYGSKIIYLLQRVSGKEWAFTL